MPKIYTPNDLIRYIYKETTASENLNLDKILKTNEQAAESLESFQTMVDQLHEAELMPNPTSVSLILEYSQKLHEPAH